MVLRAIRIIKCPTAHTQNSKLSRYLRCRCRGQELAVNVLPLHFGFLEMVDAYNVIALFSRIDKINGPIYRTIR